MMAWDGADALRTGWNECDAGGHRGGWVPSGMLRCYLCG